MRWQPAAMPWVNPLVSTAPDWDAAQARRLARQLGFVVVPPSEVSLVPLVDQARAADVDAVIVPSPDHVDAYMLHALMCIVDVETVCPRMSFARWSELPRWGRGRLG
ncbi:hypothetical protein [Nocardia wallacei]|uniref:hypothetical protein n=1 Tax=Nocardia wallacei TaxID=480035 RepID=UPI0024567061|nr:hypothetical protein [Nocardia wallacei]